MDTDCTQVNMDGDDDDDDNDEDDAADHNDVSVRQNIGSFPARFASDTD